MNTQRFLLHAQLIAYQKKEQKALDTIEKALEMMKNPYVAFSTGKDSTVLLDLVRQVAPETPAVYFDADAAYPESTEMLDTPNVIKFKTEPILETFQKWGILHPQIEKKTMESTVYHPIKALLAEYEFDGVFLGLRAEESYGRKQLAKSKKELIFLNKRDKIWECIPLSWWTYDDIWAYIFSHKLKYNTIYDQMDMLTEKERRVSYWAGETNRQGGRWVWLARFHPELFNKFARCFPEVRFFQ